MCLRCACAPGGSRRALGPHLCSCLRQDDMAPLALFICAHCALMLAAEGAHRLLNVVAAGPARPDRALDLSFDLVLF